MRTIETARPLPALAFVAALAAGAGFLLNEKSTAAPAPATRDDARTLSSAFRDVARHISPSVVGVVVIHERTDSSNRDHPSDERRGPLEQFKHFFGQGDPFFGDPEAPDELPWSMPMPMPLQGQGTGVIVDKNGIIATNNHVVAGAKRVEITLQDGRKLDAEVVGTDPETDLALVRVDAKDLPAAKLGDSTQLQPGDWVVAVGNPFGLDHSVTVGVVSATGRSGIGVANYENFIQTDAAINPGNSGGPLLNLDGEVIGINTAIRTSNGGSDGISFAIPSSTLASILPELVSKGHVSRGWLGVTLQLLTPELAKSFGAEGARGVLISQVLANTPAEKAGLRAGDIVVSVNGKTVAEPRKLSEAVAGMAPGAKAELTVVRDGQEQTIAVTLAERPSRDALAQRGRGGEGERREEPRGGGFGLKLSDVPEGIAREFDLSGGALVREVEHDSPAARAGVTPGEVLLSIDREKIASADEAYQRLSAADEGARILVRARDGSTRWAFLDKNDKNG